MQSVSFELCIRYEKKGKNKHTTKDKKMNEHLDFLKSILDTTMKKRKESRWSQEIE